MTTTIALIGCSNVGKSTLYYKITHQKQFFNTHLKSTLDSQYKYVLSSNKKYILIDTPAFVNKIKATKIQQECLKNTLLAINQAHLILFIVDIQQGCTHTDILLSKLLISKKKNTILVLNKSDTTHINTNYTQFYKLGCTSVHFTSALKNTGISELFKKHIIPNINKNTNFTKITNIYKPQKIFQNEKNFSNNTIKISIIGKPNVGKSTLINKLSNSNRVITDAIAGTTQNNIEIPIYYKNQKYIFIDTAGIRKKNKINSKIEKIFSLQSINALKYSNIVLILLEIHTYNCKQNIKLINLASKYGRSIIIAINKCDIVSALEIKKIKKFISNYLNNSIFYNIKIYFISALLKIGINNLMSCINKTYHTSIYDFNTSKLTKILHCIIKNHEPPIINKKRIKLKFAHPGGKNPFKIIIYGNQTNYLHTNYKKYLTNTFKKKLKILGNQLILVFKNTHNPYLNS